MKEVLKLLSTELSAELGIKLIAELSLVITSGVLIRYLARSYTNCLNELVIQRELKGS